MAYTIKFIDPPKTCPTGFADFDTLAALIASPEFFELVVGDEILRRNSTALQVCLGEPPFEDITEAFCEYVYVDAGYPDLFNGRLDMWPELMTEWALSCSDYARWEAVCYSPDGDADRSTPCEIRAVSRECVFLIREAKAQQVAARQVTA